MENITTDMHELEKGMELTKREYAARKDSRDCPVILKDFLANAEDRFKKLLADVKTAQVRQLLPLLRNVQLQPFEGRRFASSVPVGYFDVSIIHQI